MLVGVNPVTKAPIYETPLEQRPHGLSSLGSIASRVVRAASEELGHYAEAEALNEAWVGTNRHSDPNEFAEIDKRYKETMAEIERNKKK